MKIIKSIIFYGIITVSAVCQNLNDFKIMTETYPPYNFKEGGELKGIAVEMMGEILKDIGSSKTIKDVKLLPWARAYKDCMAHTSTCLFSMTRTEERSKHFAWAGPISPTRVVVIAPKGKVRIANDVDLKKYKFGVVIDDIGEQLLKDKGVDKEKLEGVSQLKINLKKLEKGRIDAIAYEENVAFYTIKSLGMNPADYETVYVLKEGELYFAFNIKEKKEVLDKVQKAVDKLKEDGRKQKIMEKYLK